MSGPPVGQMSDRTGPMSPRPAPVRVLTELVRQVLVEPVRSGRLRSDGWPVGVRPPVVLGLTIYVLATVTTIVGGVLRRSLPPGDSAFGISPALFGVGVVMVVVLASLVTAASLHLGGVLGVVGLLPAPIAWASLLPYAQHPGEEAWLLVGTAALVSLAIWRRRHAFAWWEFPLVAAVIGAVTTGILLRVTGPALANDYFDVGVELVVLIMAVAILAVPLTAHAGAAVSEVAVSTARWLVELITRELPRRAYGPVLVIALVGAWGLTGWRWSRSVLPVGPHLVALLVAALVVVLTALIWLLAGPVGTGLEELIETFRPVALTLSIAATAPFVLSFIWGRFEYGLRPALLALGVDYIPGSLIDRLRLGDVLTTITAGYPVAVAVGAVLTVVALRRRRLPLAQLAGIATVLCAIRGAAEFGVPYLTVSLDDLSAVILLVATIAALGWLVRGQLGPRRLEAVAVAVLIALAVTSRDLLADPLAWLLQSAGGVLVIIGLLWTLLTFAGDANVDSAAAPRPARALALVAYLSVAAVIAAFDALAVTFAIDLDRFVRIGMEVFGTALLIAAIWSVLGRARLERG